MNTTKSENILGNEHARLKTAMKDPEIKMVGFRPNLSVKGPMITAPKRKPRNTAATAKVP